MEDDCVDRFCVYFASHCHIIISYFYYLSRYAIFSTYDLLSHTEKMKIAHPNWTQIQRLNVLYWQGTARKMLKENIELFNQEFRKFGYFSTTSPEAMGVDVTRTLQNAGIQLEWPARKIVYKVAFAGIPLDEKYKNILR